MSIPAKTVLRPGWKKNRASGFVFFMMLLFITGLVVEVEVGLMRSVMGLRTSNQFLSRQQAFQLAEAGLDAKIAQLLDTDTSNDSATLQQTLSTGESYNVTLTNIGGTAWQLTSVGTGTSNTSKTLQMVVEVTSANVFQQAIFGKNEVRIQDSPSLVDSYRSTLGPYNGAIVPSDPVYGSTNKSMPGNAQSYQGTIRTNSTDDCDAMRLEGNINIYGDAIIGAGGNPSDIRQEGGALVWGQKKAASSNLTLDPVVLPAGIPSGGNLGLNGSAQSITLPAGTYYFDEIDLENGANLYTNGQVIIYVKVEARVTGGSSMRGRIGGVDTPSALSLLSTASSATCTDDDNCEFRIENGTFVGTAYTPLTSARFRSNANVYGAVVAQEVRNEEGSQFHFDASLTSVSANRSPAKIRVRFWKE